MTNNTSDERFSLPKHLKIGGELSNELILRNKLFIAKGAIVIGDIRAGKDVSFWYNCVVRGDVNFIEIANGTNLQDGVIVHVTNIIPCKIGKNVTIGHGAIVHGATIEESVLIGMGSTILSGAIIGEGSIVAAGAVIKENENVPPYSLMAGIPAKKIKTLPNKTFIENVGWAKKYIALKNKYLLSNNS